MAGDFETGSVAAGASARVAEILEKAERQGRELNEQAERDAASARSDAEAEAEAILAEAREAARAAATERVQRLAELQGALARRGPAVLEGLEGAGLTRARLEALIEALAASAERVLAEAEEGEPGGTAADGDASPGPEAASPEDAEAEPEPASPEDAEAEEAGAGEDDADPVAAAEELAQPVDAEVVEDVEPDADGDGAAASDGNGDDPTPQPYDGPLPEGAPMARKPLRSPERDARFAALLLAVQGRERGDVEAHLRNEYGFADCEPILDEVFGRAPA